MNISFLFPAMLASIVFVNPAIIYVPDAQQTSEVALRSYLKKKEGAIATYWSECSYQCFIIKNGDYNCL